MRCALVQFAGAPSSAAASGTRGLAGPSAAHFLFLTCVALDENTLRRREKCPEVPRRARARCRFRAAGEDGQLGRVAGVAVDESEVWRSSRGPAMSTTGETGASRALETVLLTGVVRPRPDPQCFCVHRYIHWRHSKHLAGVQVADNHRGRDTARSRAVRPIGFGQKTFHDTHLRIAAKYEPLATRHAPGEQATRTR